MKIRASYGILGDDGTALGLAEFAFVEGYNYNDAWPFSMESPLWARATGERPFATLPG